ncbi:MAG: AI-2E family transporter [Alphaproteobacteria bacterium]
MSISAWILTILAALLTLTLIIVSQSVLTPFVAGLVLAYILSPLVERMISLGLPRSLASALPVALAIVVIGVGLAFVLPLLVEQVTLFIQKVPMYINQLQQSVVPPKVARALHMKTMNQEAVLKLLGIISTDGAGWLATNMTRLYSGALAAFNMAMLVVMTPLVAFYLLHDWPDMETRMLRALPRRWRPTVVEIMASIDTRLSAYLRGQLMVCSILAVFYATALEMIGLELGWVLGLVAGFLAFIPVVGAMIAVTGMMAMAFVQYQFTDWQPFAVVGCIYVVGHVLEGSILTPTLVGNKVGLHPVWVIFALLVGGEVGGIMGMVVAIPVAVVVSVILPYLLQAWHKAVV